MSRRALAGPAVVRRPPIRLHLRDNPVVDAAVRSPLADDTSLDVEARQVALWQRMSREDKAVVVSGLCRAVFEAATEGVRRRYPDSTPREQFLRLAILRLGRELAVEAFPDAADLQN